MCEVERICSSSGDFWPGVDSIRSPQKLLLSNSSFAAELLKLIQYRNSSQLLKNYAFFFINKIGLFNEINISFWNGRNANHVSSNPFFSHAYHSTEWWFFLLNVFAPAKCFKFYYIFLEYVLVLLLISCYFIVFCN